LGLYVLTIVSLHGRRLVEMATAARLPTMLPADWEAHRPLLTYGSSLVDGVRLMAAQADRALRGTRVGELPVEVVTRHRLTVNRGGARETIPPEVLARADQVID
jgi:putative ABC transport system substrate-binding protein